MRGMGGGILVSGPGVSLTISDSNLFENDAVQGGGIANRGGTLTVVRSTLTGNHAGGATAGGEGGGIYSESTTTVRNSTISANVAANGEVPTAQGGGIYVNSGTFTAESTTLAGNVADEGTAIYRRAGTVTLSRTIVSTIGATRGRAMRRLAVRRLAERRRRCDVRSLADACAARVTAGQRRSDEHPLAGQPRDQQRRTSCPADDQRGLVRPAEGDCDIGAVEAGASPDEGELRLFTQVINNSGGSAAAASFAIHVLRDGIDAVGSPAEGNAQGHDIHVPVGDYVVAAAASGYTTQVTGACAPNGAVTVAANDSKVCTLTFDDIAQQPGGGGGTQPPPPRATTSRCRHPSPARASTCCPRAGTVRIKVAADRTGSPSSRRVSRSRSARRRHTEGPRDADRRRRPAGRLLRRHLQDRPGQGIQATDDAHARGEAQLPEGGQGDRGGQEEEAARCGATAAASSGPRASTARRPWSVRSGWSRTGAHRP